MSNDLINAAQRLRQIIPVGAKGIALPARDMHPSEMAVMLALANEARKKDGDISTLTTVKIMARTRLSEPAVRKAYRQLQANGHITRIRGAEGEPATTKVHPKLTPFTTTSANTWVSSVPETPILNTGDPCIEDMGLIENKNLTKDHSPRASAREVSFFQDEATPAPAAAPAAEPEPVAQVFAAWNAMAARCGLPGPVGRDVPREAAIDALLAREKLWRVLSAIEAVGRSPWLTGNRRDGQGDWMATFDWVFEVRRFAGSGNFNRILEGEFNRGQAVPVDPPTPAAAAPLPPPGRDEPEPTRRLRAVLRDRLGERNAATWIDPLRFDWQAEALRVIAPNAFLADWVTGHFTGHLDRAAREVAGGPISVRISVRERV